MLSVACAAGVEPIDEALRYAASSIRTSWSQDLPPRQPVPVPSHAQHMLAQHTLHEPRLPDWLHDPLGAGAGHPLTAPHARDELLAYLIAHNMPVTLDGLLPAHGEMNLSPESSCSFPASLSLHKVPNLPLSPGLLCATGWDSALFHHPAFQGPEPYDCAAALTIVLACETKGGYGFYRRAKLLQKIAAVAIDVSMPAGCEMSASVRYVLTGALQAQPPQEAAVDDRNWRHLRSAVRRSLLADVSVH